MTAVAERTGARGLPAGPGLGVRFRWAVTDTLTITRRNLLIWMRVPAYLVFTVIQPVLFVLMFRYVFGGAIPVKVRGGYVNFLMPGIIAQTAAFATFGTAIALAAPRPGCLQAFANNQPVTYVIDTRRALALGGPVAANLWKSIAWLAGIFIVFLPLAVRAYRRAS